jgi:hypothetical protein
MDHNVHHIISMSLSESFFSERSPAPSGSWGYILLQFYRINKTAKCQSMSIDVRQEWRCKTCDGQQEHESPTLTPKHTIRIGASSWGVYEQWISYLWDVPRYNPKSIHAPNDSILNSRHRPATATKHGLSSWWASVRAGLVVGRSGLQWHANIIQRHVAPTTIHTKINRGVPP